MSYQKHLKDKIISVKAEMQADGPISQQQIVIIYSSSAPPPNEGGKDERFRARRLAAERVGNAASGTTSDAVISTTSSDTTTGKSTATATAQQPPQETSTLPQQWDSLEYGELQVWARILKAEAPKKFKGETVPLPHSSWNIFIESVALIRHKAVHREPLSVADVEAYLADADSLVRLLR
ncbi:ubiquinol-cytochrome-c reductase cytochrome c1 [Colletotrichum orchidophilum]|uniref:Ubiquinol-cytochrome-c reductase cytochrome c1 n=1 Tax=Colletotrichum orchidophilum TaxID=1209926 RepID=A0A1G4BLS5_9PEZI|nr:ubiquinol-cytochrome-c reductase cytochrome c1 [Colletotrichum orchidophilum]OHF02243.1 ubiquinol-cytochrome-c reductase cytochrome c1 [Colletotrichum orchidophilum]